MNIASVYLGNRKSECSTEHYLYLDRKYDRFFVELHHGLPSAGPRVIGYAEYQFATEDTSEPRCPMLHVLCGLLSADSQCPGPIIPLKGALYRRREVFESLREAEISDLQEAIRRRRSAPLSVHEECPHDI
ncbi:hypothetical protein LMG33810_002853 [Carnimonas sp. LMG 33810]